MSLVGPAELAPAAPASAPPLGEAAEILCPMCRYDLRGLAEPRCPECGYAFVWEDLTDPARRLHPYFFEHHPDRPAWSFVRTLLGGLLPRRFWGSLNPAGPARPRRMVAYWLIVLLAAVPGLALTYATAAVRLSAECRAGRAGLAGYYNMPGNEKERAKWERDVGMTLPQYLERYLPLPPAPRFFRAVFASPMVMPIAMPLLMWVLWPWVTAALLRVVLWSTLRQAKVRAIHLLRCGVYCCDTFLWAWLTAAGVGAVFAYDVLNAPPATGTLAPMPGYFLIGSEEPLWAALGVAIGLAALLTPYRLWASYRRYLRIPHAAAVVLLTQFIVLVVVLIASGGVFQTLVQP